MYRFCCLVLTGVFLSAKAQELSKRSVQIPDQGRVVSIYKSPSYEKMRGKMKRDFPSEFRFWDNYAFDNELLNEYITNYLKYTRREYAKNISAASVGLVLGIPSLLLSVGGIITAISGDTFYGPALLFGGVVLLGGATAAIVVPLHLSARKDRKKALHFSMEMARMMP